MQRYRPPCGFFLGLQSGELFSSGVERIVEAIPANFKSEYEDILERARKHVGMGLNLEEDIKRLDWAFPSVDEVIEKHTHFVLARPFWSAAAAAVIRNKMIDANRLSVVSARNPLNFEGHYTVDIGVCPDCAEAQFKSAGVVYWEREACVKGNAVCVAHGCPIMRRCACCGAPYSFVAFGGRPRRTCSCGGRMQGGVEKKFLSIGQELGRDIHEVFLGSLSLITSEGLLTLFREAAKENGWFGRDITRKIEEKMKDVGVFDYFVEHIKMSVSAHVFREIIQGVKLSRSPILNMIAIRTVFGSVRELRDIIVARPELREEAVLYPSTVVNAAKNLLIAISGSSLGGGASTLNRDFNDAFFSVVVSDPSFVEKLVRRHKSRGWERRWGLRDEAVLDAIKKRFEGMQRDPICLSKGRLVGGIIDKSEMYSARHRFPKAMDYLDRHFEWGDEGYRRRLKRLAYIYPDCLDRHLRGRVKNVMSLEGSALYYAVNKLEGRVRQWRLENGHDGS